MQYVDIGVYGDVGFNPYDAGYNYETGWFGSKLLKKVGRAVSRPVASIGKRFGKVGYGIGKGFVSAAKGIAPIVGTALPYIQTAMKNMGPMGMIASGAAGALAGVVQGKSLENIAWAAAEGATPSGIDRVIGAAHQLRKGAPILQVAIGQARQQFAPGSPAQHAFDLGVKAARGGAKGALANARNNIGGAVQKAAFDAAVGTIAKAAKNLPAGPTLDPRISLRNPRIPQMNMLRPATNLAVAALRRNPALRFMPPQMASLYSGLPMRRIIEARGIVETGTVTEKLNTYVIRSGDTGYNLAKKFTGDGNRWREIPQVNKVGMGAYKQSRDMKIVNKIDPKTKKVVLTTLDPFYSGLTINLPGDWAGQGVIPQGPMVPAPSTTSPPIQSPPIPGAIPAPPPVVSAPPPISYPSPVPPMLPPATVPASNNPIPMPTPLPIPGTQTGDSPIPFPAPPVVKPPDAAPIPGTTADKKKKDAAAIALALAGAGLLFFV